MGSFKVKSTIDAGNGKVYRRGDTIEISDEEAFDIRHALKNGPQQDPRALRALEADEDDDFDEDEIDVDAGSKEPMARAPRRPDDLNRVDAASNRDLGRVRGTDGVGETATSKAVDAVSGQQPPSGVGGPENPQPDQSSGPSTASGPARPDPKK